MEIITMFMYGSRNPWSINQQVYAVKQTLDAAQAHVKQTTLVLKDNSLLTSRLQASVISM
jgi:hypothetical protein